MLIFFRGRFGCTCLSIRRASYVGPDRTSLTLGNPNSSET